MTDVSPPVKAAIYARISSDEDGRGLGVARQIQDCTALAARHGWTVVATYTDNDVSATSKRKRPQYERMMLEAAAGRFSSLLVYDVDRLTRTPRELEDIIDLSERCGLALASVGGEIDLAAPQGRMMARMKGTVARHETDQQSRRIKRKFLERAEAGLPHAFAAFGYRRVIVRDTADKKISSYDEINEPEAQVIRDAAQRLLSGESLRSVTAGINEQGIRTPRGGRWSSTQLRQLMIRERNAGRRIHQQKVIGDAAWPSVYEDPETHDRVVSLLLDPARRTQKGSTRVHLLSGIALCGRCGASEMVVNGGASRPPAYSCSACFKIRRKQADVDAVVDAVMMEWLKDPEALNALSTGDPLELEAAQMEIASCEAKLKRAADEFADSDDEDAMLVLRRVRAKLRPRIDVAKAAIAVNMPAMVPLEMTGQNAAQHWRDAPLDVKRELIRLGWTVTILPTKSGLSFDPSLVKLERKTTVAGT